MKPPTYLQRQALQLMAEGHTQKGAARKLNVGEEAFKQRLRELRAKWGVRTNLQAAVIAARQGII